MYCITGILEDGSRVFWLGRILRFAPCNDISNLIQYEEKHRAYNSLSRIKFDGVKNLEVIEVSSFDDYNQEELQPTCGIDKLYDAYQQQNHVEQNKALSNLGYIQENSQGDTNAKCAEVLISKGKYEGVSSPANDLRYWLPQLIKCIKRQITTTTLGVIDTINRYNSHGGKLEIHRRENESELAAKIIKHVAFVSNFLAESKDFLYPSYCFRSQTKTIDLIINGYMLSGIVNQEKSCNGFVLLDSSYKLEINFSFNFCKTYGIRPLEKPLQVPLIALTSGKNNWFSLWDENVFSVKFIGGAIDKSLSLINNVDVMDIPSIWNMLRSIVRSDNTNIRFDKNSLPSWADPYLSIPGQLLISKSDVVQLRSSQSCIGFAIPLVKVRRSHGDEWEDLYKLMDWSYQVYPCDVGLAILRVKDGHPVYSFTGKLDSRYDIQLVHP